MTCGSAGSMRTMVCARRRLTRLAGLARGRTWFDTHFLLRRRLQMSGILRANPQALHGGEHVFWLSEKGIPESLGPVQLVVHRYEHLRKRHQRFDADVPCLILDGLYRGVALHVRMRFDPPASVHDFQRIRRGHQHLRQQRIRIECDRRDQPLQFLGRILLGRRLGRRGGQRRQRRSGGRSDLRGRRRDRGRGCWPKLERAPMRTDSEPADPVVSKGSLSARRGGSR